MFLICHAVLFLCKVMKQESRLTNLQRKQVNKSSNSKFVCMNGWEHGICDKIMY